MKNLEKRISVVVVSYNSSLTITETLNSVLAQSFDTHNIELIVCDDHSSDNTCEIVDKWFSYNCQFFFRTLIIKSDRNLGISANVNRGWSEATSPWIKAIAADDILLFNCLSDNSSFIKRYSDARIVFSDLQVFKGHFQYDKNLIKRHDPNFFELTNQEQLKLLLYDNKLIAPSAFISKNLLEEVGYAEESFKMIEDYPLWLKMCKAQVVFYYLPAVTVAYRYTDSLSNNHLRICNMSYAESSYKFRKENVWPHWKHTDMLRKFDEMFSFYELKWSHKFFKNRRTRTYLSLHYLLFFFKAI